MPEDHSGAAAAAQFCASDESDVTPICDNLALPFPILLEQFFRAAELDAIIRREPWITECAPQTI